jgi:hypothetical protein
MAGDLTSKASGGTPDGGFLGLLCTVALIAVVAGAAGSVGLMLLVGHRNPSRALLVLFAGWVLSPFIGLGLADRISKGWSVPTRATLHAVMLVVTLGSLAMYGRVAFGPPRPTPAAMFLVVPVGSWLLAAIAVPLAAFISGRKQKA